MKRLLCVTTVMALTLMVSLPAMAGVNVNIGIPLPPPILFPAPPAVVVLPDTSNVYVAPELDVDFYFWNGWWWRLWDGRWYRSRHHNRGWGYYRSVPRFYYDIDPGWRGYYRNRSWRGHSWNYRHIPQGQLNRNWKKWRDNRHWERGRRWDVQRYSPPTSRQRRDLRLERQRQYRQRPDVRRWKQQEKQRGRGGEGRR